MDRINELKITAVIEREKKYINHTEQTRQQIPRIYTKQAPKSRNNLGKLGKAHGQIK